MPFWSWKWLKQGFGGGGGGGGRIYGVQNGNSHCDDLIEEKESRGLFCPLEPKHHICNRTGKIIQFWCFISKKWRLIKINQIGAFCYLPDQMKNSCNLQSRTKLFEKVFPIISRTTHCGEKTPSPNSMLLPTNAKGSGFLLNTQRHCFQGKREREQPVPLRCLEKCCPSIQFSQQFCPRL